MSCHLLSEGKHNTVVFFQVSKAYVVWFGPIVALNYIIIYIFVGLWRYYIVHNILFLAVSAQLEILQHFSWSAQQDWPLRCGPLQRHARGHFQQGGKAWRHMLWCYLIFIWTKIWTCWGKKTWSDGLKPHFNSFQFFDGYKSGYNQSSDTHMKISTWIKYHGSDRVPQSWFSDG